MVVSPFKACLIPPQSLVKHPIVASIDVIFLHLLADLAPHLVKKSILHELLADLAPIDRKDVLESDVAPQDALELFLEGLRCALVVVQELDLLKDPVCHLRHVRTRPQIQVLLAPPTVLVLILPLQPASLVPRELRPDLPFN